LRGLGKRANTRVQRITGHLVPQPAAGKQFKVAVLGAAGGIGQPLSLLMKQCAFVHTLSLYDIVGTPGVAADLSHIETGATVHGFAGQEQLGDALTGCDLVIIPAGVPRKPGMTRDDLFNTNAGIVKTLCEGIAKFCPGAIVNIISNPVNSTVPIAAEVFKKAGCYDPKRLLGVTTLDVVRSNTFIGDLKGVDPQLVDVPVIGGHAGITILPLLSQVTPKMSFTADQIASLTERIQNAGTEVVKAKAGKGSATLSMAFAAARMGESCLKGLSGIPAVECAYVASTVTEVPFFATKVTLGPEGIGEVHGTGPLSAFEAEGVKKLLPDLTKQIAKGVEFAKA